ncbi:cob(I)yrinic acid a,c-diamide adenosyltransferase [candidate division CSSED10-310 bacterium]|uniref:Cob(I)yrinic acid a,c-diamide adenosyltransferase n=1 Tax=candidate division CSSED10-310 bacterium TaxID=2855610 RepID=A0ABV6YSN1_UNCC1
MEKGFLHVYTGDGKGKTTAALGLALRAVGAGLKVFVAQFVKGMKYSEFESLKKLSDFITIRQYGRDCFIYQEPTPEDITLARNGLQEVREILISGDYDLVILDEATIANHYNLFSVVELLQVIDSRSPHVELVITGRNADQRLIDKADLVTEMKEIKHYYQRGIQARTGIEK